MSDKGQSVPQDLPAGVVVGPAPIGGPWSFDREFISSY